MLDVGKWKLPLYQGNSNPEETEDGADKFKRAPNVFIGIKIGYGDSAFILEKVSKKTDITDYTFPSYHIPSH